MTGGASARLRLAVSGALLLLALPPGVAGATAPGIGRQDNGADVVVLLHGLGRTSRSMRKIEKRLDSSGYAIENIDYPSRSRSIEELVADLDERLRECCLDRGGKIHFVTHSLGGILTRAYLGLHRPPNLGRVVMLSPPNKGSAVVDALGENWLFGLTLGPAARQLRTSPESVPNRLGPADYELGVITGDHSWNPLGSWLLEGKDDGAVSVESARLEGMKSFLLVPRTHTFIMNDRRVIEEVLNFLDTGDFTGISPLDTPAPPSP